MNRRPRLPGADELFRSTGGAGGGSQVAVAAEPQPAAQDMPSPHRGSVAQPGAARRAIRPADDGVSDGDTWAGEAPPVRSVRVGRQSADARPTGRERHDEKITVYCSPEELLQLEHARLTLRGAHGLAVDRGRIVREAVAVVLADLDAKGESSILVRRLRGR